MIAYLIKEAIRVGIKALLWAAGAMVWATFLILPIQFWQLYVSEERSLAFFAILWITFIGGSTVGAINAWIEKS